ncbi:FxSxx-COOH cyclophane-containing RiPP peptide [Streptomyces sp. NPDC127190]|uniref:FxSxx-COOH cyclophane-containing RiPP peptide n=1 Tax=unclassified Streptomyces TaxID=2593676 RepID=UPI00362B30AE
MTRAAGLGEHAVRAVVPPDLTDVDLRTLRAMDDPALLAAVAGVLADPEGLGRVWYTTDTDTLVPGGVTGHMFSAGHTRRAPTRSLPGTDTVA